MLSNTAITAIVTAAATVVTTAIMAFIARLISGIHKTMKRFMAEHLYLLRSTDWSKTNLMTVLEHLNIQPSEPPPENPLRFK